jgi:hypothetical protein
MLLACDPASLPRFADVIKSKVYIVPAHCATSSGFLAVSLSEQK